MCGGGDGGGVCESVFVLWRLFIGKQKVVSPLSRRTSGIFEDAQAIVEIVCASEELRKKK